MEDITKQISPDFQEYLIRVDNNFDIAFHGKVLAEVRGEEINSSFAHADRVSTILTIYETKPSEQTGRTTLVLQKACKFMGGDQWQPENGPSSRESINYEKDASFLGELLKEATFLGESLHINTGSGSKTKDLSVKDCLSIFNFFGYEKLAKDLYIKAGIDCVQRI